MKSIVIRHILFWFLLMFIAIGNGVLRVATYGQAVRELIAHQISTVTGILFTGLAAWALSRSWPLESVMQALAVGISWLSPTLIFEFTFGHFVAGHSWEQLRQDYNLLEGRVWLIFLIWVVAMPYIFYKISHAKV